MVHPSDSDSDGPPPLVSESSDDEWPPRFPPPSSHAGATTNINPTSGPAVSDDVTSARVSKNKRHRALQVLLRQLLLRLLLP